MLFLRRLEEVFGRERFDGFLRGYFSNFAFQSITTGDFIEYLEKNLIQPNAELAKSVNLKEWISEPGLPATTPVPRSEALDAVSAAASSWISGKTATASLPVRRWSSPETLHFLHSVGGIDATRMADLDRNFHFTDSGNSEILFEWLMMTIKNKYQPAYPKLEKFLREVGRRKFIKPLYQELAKSPEGKQRAAAIYKRARPGYHPIAAMSIDEVLK
jgi:hypothetical protein